MIAFNSHNELVAFFKALADSSRLKIVGLLAQKPYSVEQLAAILNLRPPTISHHLAKLAEVGLVSARTVSYYNIYQLEEAALKKIRPLFSQQELPFMAEGVDVNAYDRKVVADYSTRDGSFKTIPAQRKKLEVILRHVAKSFEPGVKYTERQVNKTLSRFHQDTATLRRELVGYRLMQRSGGGEEYWLIEQESD